ncbi:MAG: methyltransferase domain-containing protein [Beijerinckiaceae bacterium]|nr:methyltransferase domain-containing protein [Beijerinckiaceae bacterium]
MTTEKAFKLTRRGALLGAATLLAAPAIVRRAHAQGEPVPRLDVPFVPTPQQVVDKMLELANVQKTDFLIDLGSGDGRIPVTAAQRFGVRALGVDINPQRIKEANERAQAAAVTNLVEFRQADLFETDISQANVLTMYLLPSVNMKLRPKIWSDMKPGSRVVSHAFDMGDWAPEQKVTVDGRTVYLWTVPPRKA